MVKAVIRQIFIITLLLIVATAFIVVTNMDIKVATFFYKPGQGFPYGNQQPWRALYLYGEWPAFLMGGAALLIFIGGFFRKKLAPYRIASLFLVLLLIIGPGLIVNAVLKDHWGRPRPRQVSEFGGSRQFQQPWQKGSFTECKSFSCGHASVAFYLGAPYFVLRRKKRRQARAWLIFGIGYGLIMGIARIAQGGHFVSDVLWSGGMIFLVGILLAAIMRLDSRTDTYLKENVLLP